MGIMEDSDLGELVLKDLITVTRRGEMKGDWEMAPTEERYTSHGHPGYTCMAETVL